MGKFGEQTICGLTTDDTGFAFNILGMLTTEFRAPTTLEALSEAANRAARSISAQITTLERAASKGTI